MKTFLILFKNERKWAFISVILRRVNLSIKSEVKFDIGTLPVQVRSSVATFVNIVAGKKKNFGKGLHNFNIVSLFTMFSLIRRMKVYYYAYVSIHPCNLPYIM